MESPPDREDVARRLGLALLDALALTFREALTEGASTSGKQVSIDRKAGDDPQGNEQAAEDARIDALVEDTAAEIAAVVAEHGTSLAGESGWHLAHGLVGAMNRLTDGEGKRLGMDIYQDAEDIALKRPDARRRTGRQAN